jgi:predicted AAA+ superfamily ATPase
MIYPRRLTNQLKQEVTNPRTTVLTGMRQTGKTTLMRQIFNLIESSNKLFLDLENPLNQKIFEEVNYDNIIHNLREFNIHIGKKCYIFLDEIQLLPESARIIKYLYDHYKIKFFVTGSSSFYLKNLFPESLAGRKTIYELYPLDFEEFLVFKQVVKSTTDNFINKARKKTKVAYELYKKHYDEYLKYGGFPGVVIEPDMRRKQKILQDIFTSYFEKDVTRIADFKDIRKLRDTILLLANRVGSKIEITKIASEIGISRDTVYSYLSFLENTYFIYLLKPFSRNIDGEVKGANKVYFCDSGLLNQLVKFPEGVIFENTVFTNLKKYGKVNYYQKYKGPEVDFILNEKMAFEVKTIGNIGDIKQLSKIIKNLRLKDYYLIIKEYFDHPKAILATDL